MDWPVARPTGSRGSLSLREQRTPAELLASGREHERAGCVAEASGQYRRAAECAGEVGQRAIRAEALRRLAILSHHGEAPADAHRLGEEALAAAQATGESALVAEALNTLGVMCIREGDLAGARMKFLRALDSGADDAALRARIERNLGVIANIQGELEEAQERYLRSLEFSRAADDETGCAHAYHNLGMVCADRDRLEEAEAYFQRSLDYAEAVGDVRLRGHCLVNRADLHLVRQRFEAAREDAEAALAVFDQMGARDHKASAYRVIGVVYRETGKLALAESRLRSAIELSRAATSVLTEAESTRELAVLFQAQGRNQEALIALNGAHGLFARLDARIDLVHVGGRLADLESTYLDVVQTWGQSIESSDSYTHGHCSRVADVAVRVAEVLGLGALEVTTIRLGAYLHDLGKVRVPHEILNKPGRLTPEEFAVVQQHPVWGIELLQDIEFPWDLKPIIRWHHEKADGSGYPDRLRGAEIPVAAQVVGIADVYDALTTTRAYRAAMPHEAALAEIGRMSAAWSPAVVAAFTQAMDRAAPPVAA